MNTEQINYREARDFGQTFNVAIKFIRQNFKLFFICVICISGPFILISSVAGAYYQSNAINMMSLTRMGGIDSILGQFGLTYFIFILTAIIANIAMTATVYGYMITYNEKGVGNFTVNDVARTVIKNIGNILAVFFVFLLLIILILVVVVVIFVGIGSAVPMLAVLLGIAVFFGLVIIFPPIMWQLNVVYLVKMQEGGSVFEAWGRTRLVMKGSFWWTWLITVCAMFAIGIAGMIFSLPMAIYNMVLMFSRVQGGGGDTSLLFLIVATVCAFLTTILHSVYSIINGFHYYSLSEKRDGKGLMDKINEIGNVPKADENQQY